MASYLFRGLGVSFIASLMLQNGVLAIPAVQSGPLPAHEATIFGFERQDNRSGTAWVPSPEILAEQAALYENLYVLDPETNKTIRNPEYGHGVEKRATFNPPGGAECRIVAQHNWNFDFSGSGGGDESAYLVIQNHQNTGVQYAYFDINDFDIWKPYPLSNHRAWWMDVGDNLYDTSGWRHAYGHIEGRQPDRNMMGSDYCWYSKGTAWWGVWGAASCTDWCDNFNW